MNKAWFVDFSRVLRPTHRLFCFPYAGGSAQIFRGWQALMPAAIEVVGIQTPGKGARVLEPPHTSLCTLVDDLLDAIRPRLAQGPFTFFGHSNGALIAFELARRMQREGLPRPQHLFLSANPAPWTRIFDPPHSSLSDADFREMLRRLEGTPPAVLANEELLALMLPGLRADFALAESFQCDGTRLGVPTTVFHGAHDAIGIGQIHAWQERISAPVDYERIEGGHFFIHTHESLLVRSICRQLLSARPQPLDAVAQSA